MTGTANQSSGRSGVQIAIIGAGLAAHSAAATVHQAGADALLVGAPSPGASALWSGLGQAFGPAGDFPATSTGLPGADGSPMALRTDRDRRFDVLGRRRPCHPYRRLSLGRSDVADHLAAALNSLGYPGLRPIGPEAVFMSPAGAPYPADLAASSVVGEAAGAGESIGVVRCPALGGWHPKRLADALDQVDTLRAAVIDVDPVSGLDGHDQHSVRVATQLAGVLDADPTMLADGLVGAADAARLDAVIFPPCLGADWTSHRAIFSALEDAASCRVAEAPAAQNSVHGWRLDRFLRANNPVATRPSRAVDADIDAQHLRRMSVDAAGDPIEADAFILATGRWIGGGLPRQMPLREPITGAPLWVDDAPLTNPDQTRPARLLGEYVWDDHRLFRAGVAIDGQLRPLDRDRSPVADNLFAAGRILAGSNAFWDGTAQGVDLITGRLAGLNALGRAGFSGANSLDATVEVTS